MDEKRTLANTPGAGQILIFVMVAVAIGIPSLLLGGFFLGYIAFLLFGAIFVISFSGKRRRITLLVYLYLAFGLLLGGVFYNALTGDETAAQVATWPLIGSLLEDTVIVAVLAVATGTVGGALAVGLPLWLLVFISAEWMLALRQTYSLERKLATRLLLDLALGRNKTFVVADEGVVKRNDLEGPLDKFGAPVAVVVKPYNAVVLERGTRVSRIEGPGLVHLQNEEEIKTVVDLRPQGESFELEALTKDNVPIRFRGSVSFRIESWRETKEREGIGDFETKGFTGVIAGPYPVYRWTLYRAVYGVSAGKNWRSQTGGTAGGQVARAIGGFLVDEIFVVSEDERLSIPQSILKEIIEQAKEKAIEKARDWGVTVNSVNVFDVKMPEDVQKVFISRWREPWLGWRTARRAEVELYKAQTESQAKALSWEERYKQSLLKAIDQILGIEDIETRSQMLLEVVRSLQPVDTRVLSLLLESRGFSSRSLGSGAASDSSEDLEAEE